jgi:hypothetical protein
VDAITLVGIIIGSSLAIALLFAATVLSLRWWEIILIHRHRRNVNSTQQQQQLEINRKLISNHVTKVKSEAKTKSQSQTLVQLKRMSTWNELINKRVKTCEMSDIGYVFAINNQSMTVSHYTTKQKYVIPTYYIREYDQDSVFIDVSIRYLYHYNDKKENYNNNLTDRNKISE